MKKKNLIAALQQIASYKREAYQTERGMTKQIKAIAVDALKDAKNKPEAAAPSIKIVAGDVVLIRKPPRVGSNTRIEIKEAVCVAVLPPKYLLSDLEIRNWFPEVFEDTGTMDQTKALAQLRDSYYSFRYVYMRKSDKTDKNVFGICGSGVIRRK